MPSVIINTNNYSGKNANITFYPQTGGTVNVGLVTLPYTYTSNYIYGLYVLFFPEYGTTCQLIFNSSPPNDLNYLIIPDNDFYYQILSLAPIINDLNYTIIPNNDLYYQLLIPVPIIDDLRFEVILDNDFYYNIISVPPVINDLRYEVILENDLYYELISPTPIIDDFSFALIPNNDLGYQIITLPSIINDLNYITLPNNDISFSILTDICETGASYTLITEPYEPPSQGKIIFPGFTYGAPSGITNPNTFDIDGVYWNVVDNQGQNRLNYFSGLQYPSIITFKQGDNFAVYSGTSNSFAYFMDNIFHDLGFGCDPITLIQPSLNDFTSEETLCIYFENMFPTPTPEPTLVPTPTPTPIPVELILYYDFNNQSTVSGTTIIDPINGCNGNLVNGPIRDKSDCNRYLNLNGIDNYFTTSNLNPYLLPPNTSTRISVFTWIYPTDNGVIVSEQGNITPPNSDWYDSQIEMVGGTLKFAVWPHASGSITSSIPTPLNNWYYVGFTYDGTTLRAYVNGQNAGNLIVNRQTPYNNGTNLPYYYNIGGNTPSNLGNGNYGKFNMGTLEIYNGPLSESEILVNYNNNLSTWICPTPTPTETPTPTPTPTEPLVPLSLYINPNGESITFDGIVYTADTTIYVTYNVYYSVSCTPKPGFTFLGWNGYGVSFATPTQSTQVVTSLLSGANFTPSYV